MHAIVCGYTVQRTDADVEAVVRIHTEILAECAAQDPVAFLQSRVVLQERRVGQRGLHLSLHLVQRTCLVEHPLCLLVLCYRAARCALHVSGNHAGVQVVRTAHSVRGVLAAAYLNGKGGQWQ